MSDLTDLYAEIKACTRCSLAKTRTQSVPGVGPENARIMLIGEAPGFNEDKKGEPFVGQAGQFLNGLLAMAGLKREDWIHISRDVEAVVIRVPTGTQDHYPPAFGGAMAIHLVAGGERRESLACDLKELDRRLVLCYTGKPRQSGINNWEVFKDHIDGGGQVQKNLAQIAAVAREVRTALTSGRWAELGRLVNQEWALRRRNLPTISTPMIDRIIAGARRAGAVAGKVCGAGGGGCVALVIEPEARTRVEAVIEGVGATVLPMRVAREGVAVQAR